MCEELLSRFCDDYCVYPIVTASQDELDSFCESCPLVILFLQAEHSQPEKGVSGNATERDE